MSLNRKLLLLVAPPLAAIGAVIGFSVAAFAATPAPEPSANPSAPAQAAPASPAPNGSGHNCPNM
jgi:hypothetical protein